MSKIKCFLKKIFGESFLFKILKLKSYLFIVE